VLATVLGIDRRTPIATFRFVAMTSPIKPVRSIDMPTFIPARTNATITTTPRIDRVIMSIYDISSLFTRVYSKKRRDDDKRHPCHLNKL
jgi:hypothetical protein